MATRRGTRTHHLSVAAACAALFLSPFVGAIAIVPKALAAEGIHQGVASCAGSTCHGRQAPTGAVVRQNELVSWQDPSSPGGAHSRAWRTLTYPRAQAIAARLGLGPAQTAPACLGCHAEQAPPGARGARFQVSDGVGCESCHGASEGWLASHYTVGVSHAANVSRGMVALENPAVRADVCLDCHWGGDKPNQFVSHRMMSAGHPRLFFELELFTAFQQHHDVDADYRARKASADGVRTWAIGQSMALERILTVYGTGRAQDGVFPEFYFFDCHSCHRPISDNPGATLTVERNPGRPIPSGAPPFNDETMIMLAAAARTASPALAERFQADSRAFHQALTTDRASAVAAASRLASTTRALTGDFASSPFSRADTFAILDDVLGDALAPRFTDYSGGAQAVMAVDTLLTALVDQGQVDGGAVRALRPELDRAYAAVRDPNAWRPQEFRRVMRGIAGSVRRLRG